MNSARFNIISAVALNGVIGISETNTMPWHLPSDLKHFKIITSGSTVVMGHRTYQSIGRLLPNRRNVVISRNPETSIRLVDNEGVDECYPDFKTAMHAERSGFFVIGGAHIYGEALHYIPQFLYITIVNLAPEGDVKFPLSGDRFLRETVDVHHGGAYTCEFRSPWKIENDIEFQFTKFRFDSSRFY